MVLHLITALLSLGLCYGMPHPGSTAAPTVYSGAGAHQPRAGLFPQQPRNPSYQSMGSYSSSLFDPSVFPVASASASQPGGLLGQAVARTGSGRANAGASSQNLMRSIMQNTMTGRLLGLDSQEIAHLNSVSTLGARRANIDRLLKIDQIPSYNYFLTLKNKPAQFNQAQSYLMNLNNIENRGTDAQLEAFGLKTLMQSGRNPDLARMVKLDAASGVYGDRLQRAILRSNQMSLLG